MSGAAPLPFAARFVPGEDDSDATVGVLMALDARKLVCAACGGGRPRHPASVTVPRTRKAYGYALCDACHGDLKTAVERVDAAIGQALAQN